MIKWEVFVRELYFDILTIHCIFGIIASLTGEPLFLKSDFAAEPLASTTDTRGVGRASQFEA